MHLVSLHMKGLKYLLDVTKVASVKPRKYSEAQGGHSGLPTPKKVSQVLQKGTFFLVASMTLTMDLIIHGIWYPLGVQEQFPRPRIQRVHCSDIL